MTIRFLHPEMAIWLVAVAVAGAAWLVAYAYKRRSRGRAAVQPRFLRLSRRSTGVRDVAVLALTIITIGLLVAALTRPQVLRERRAAEFERQDLIVILDRSVSMRARDVRPSRAERALLELETFLRKKPDAVDRVGLVGFAGTSLVLSYLTRDVDSLLFYLDWIAEDPSVFYGTDIGAALASGLEVAARDSQPSRKLFLVISDGEDQGETMDQAVSAVMRRGIRVHTIGIGAPAEAMIPVTLPGEREGYLKDDAGRPMTTQFNETSLKSLAAATGGRYVRSVTGGELLDALHTIVRADRRQTGWQTTIEYRDVYGALLASAGLAAVALLALL
ncbi:MAG: VWA domain-containing protein [Acidobacteria bacterium]|nr:VWA domain-containing protein [Acidobacteriota bacterium]